MKLPDKFPIPDRREFWAVLDSTKLSSYARCPRRYFYEYVLGWALDVPSNHLIFGQGWHLALEHLYQGNFSPSAVAEAYRIFLECYRAELSVESDQLFKGKQPDVVPLALLEYLKTYAADAYEYRILATEVGGIVPIAPDRSLALKMDLLAEDAKGIINCIEHKTGSQAGRTWEMQWATAIQIGTYLHALASAYVDRAKDAKVIINGTFFYSKERKFQRIVSTRPGWAMLDWLDTVNRLWSNIERDFFLLSQCGPGDTNLQAFAKIPSGCTDYGGCPYFDLCTSLANPLRFVDSTVSAEKPPISGFKYRWWNPLEEVKQPLEIAV